MSCDPCVAVTPLPLYWGVSMSSSLTALEVQALTETRTDDTKVGSYQFPDAAGGYLYIALPQSFGEVDMFLLDDLNVGFIESEVTLTIGLDSIDYYLYRSPLTTFAEDVLLEVEP